MEKMKDFLHNFSDIFLSIIIGGIMFAVLSFNLGTWFTDSSNTVSADGQNIVESNHETDNNLDTNFENKDVEDKKYVEEPIEEISQNKTKNEETQKDKDIQNEDTDEKIDETEKNNDSSSNLETKTISIPNGTPGSGVAKILKNNGLIDDINDFIQIAENLNLANKLKSGSFSISTDASLEDMVRIISKQNI